MDDTEKGLFERSVEVFSLIHADSVSALGVNAEPTPCSVFNLLRIAGVEEALFSAC